MIAVICGLPGVGKSTLAKSLAPRVNATILSSDKIRKELFPCPTYSQFERKLVYDFMVIAARYLHEAGVNCILDATFNRERSRIEIKEKLWLEDWQFHVIECSCPEDVALSRLECRKEDYSDATVMIYRKMKKIYEQVGTTGIIVDTRLPPEENAERVARIMLKAAAG